MRVAGIPEKSGENVKKFIVDLFGQVSLDIAEYLPNMVDIAHKLGPQDDKRTRHIMQFTSCSHRDNVWREVSSSAVLTQNNVKIFENMLQETKDARNKLWLVVKKAKKEDKRAGFKGVIAVIKGKKHSLNDLSNITSNA